MIRVGVKEGNRITIRKVPLETYVQATILSEFAPPSGDPDVVERMLEVQAIIGRTYALAHLNRHGAEGFDMCATTHCQLFEPSRLTTSKWAAQAAMAVQRTSATVLWFHDAPVEALFNADCGGRTSRADEVWSGVGRPYLVSVEDDGPAASAHATWRYEATKGSLIAALNKDPRTTVGPVLRGIQVLDRDGVGRAERIALHGSQERIVRGEELREVLALSFGARAVKSTWFEIRGVTSSYIFEGRGFGHGVGLCQAGALARIRAGSTPPTVLQQYFPGTKLVTLRPALGANPLP
ncbi:MAG: SpoIID/LytB domain-containing protein [Acidobacteria bacterium]|nr:SpoIID/LytB domain-containing protein [Acidobacteriota bacterium]